MAEATDRKGLLLQNLEDAGCGQETIQACLRLAAGHDLDGLRRLLSGYRKKLLDTVHARQKELDCLDYLIFQLEHHQGGIFA